MRCLRGIDTLSAVGLAAEIGKFERFPRPGQLMSYLGLVPAQNDDTDAAAGRLVTYLEATLGAHVEPAHGVATRALAERLAPPEAAGLLAQAVGDASVVLVIDELERIAQARDAPAIVSAAVRYAPPAMGGADQPR